MTIPEFTIYRCLQFFLNYVATDYRNATDKSATVLADLFAKDDFGNDLKIDKLSILDNAVELIANRDVSNPRCLIPTVGYNMQRANLPTIHILLSARNKGRYDSIGHSRGEFEDTYDVVNQEVIYDKVRTFYSNISLIISSGSVNDVLTIFYFLEAMFDYFDEHMSFLGFNNFKFASQDLNLDQIVQSPDIFHRSLMLDFDIQKVTKVRQPQQIAEQFNLIVCQNIGTENT